MQVVCFVFHQILDKTHFLAPNRIGFFKHSHIYKGSLLLLKEVFFWLRMAQSQMYVFKFMHSNVAIKQLIQLQRHFHPCVDVLSC